MITVDLLLVLRIIVSLTVTFFVFYVLGSIADIKHDIERNNLETEYEIGVRKNHSSRNEGRVAFTERQINKIIARLFKELGWKI